MFFGKKRAAPSSSEPTPPAPAPQPTVFLDAPVAEPMPTLPAEIVPEAGPSSASEPLGLAGQAGFEQIVQPPPPPVSTPNVAGPQASTRPNEEVERRAERSKAAAAMLGQAITVLMRDARYRSMSLADVERLLLPSLVTGQFSLVEGPRGTNGVPSLGLLTWAEVSPEVDQRLSTSNASPVQLEPKDWRSGNILWIMEAVGDRRLNSEVLKQLRAKKWPGRGLKIRSRGQDGAIQVTVLDAQSPSQS